MIGSSGILFLVILLHARKVENYLKRMRNRKYLECLSENPDVVEKIKVRFKKSVTGSSRLNGGSFQAFIHDY